MFDNTFSSAIHFTVVSIQGAALSSRVGARLLFADSQSNVLSPPLLASLIFQILHLNFLAKSCIAHSVWLPLSLFIGNLNLDLHCCFPIRWQ